jgi:leader peptidase (prepilin peptidase)/N-methyltransferase
VTADRVAEAVLAARDDGPHPTWRRLPAAAAVAGAVLFPVAGTVAGDGWLVPAYLGFAWLTITLTVTDVRAQLIPDRINYPGSAACAGLLVLGALASGQGGDLGRAVLGALAGGGFFLAVFVLGRGRSFGFGDVKLAPVLGLFTAFAGWEEFGVGVFAGILVGGIAGLVLLVARLRTAREHFAFGPALVAGAWIGLVWGAPVAAWYLR